jgi:methanogenic corrinoid protein MtbC1
MENSNRDGRPMPGRHRARPAGEECRQSLTALIDEQIVPRLLGAHARPPGAGQTPAADGAPVTVDEIETFASHCLQDHPSEAYALMDALMGRGLASDTLLLQLITPAARYLGLLWEEDRCDFLQVTHGLTRMQEMAHALGYEYLDGPQLAGTRQRIMLACVPGSQHLLGLTIVSDFFRKAGWEVIVELSCTEAELERAVANEWFDAIGLSVSIEAQLLVLPRLVRQLRRHTSNRGLKVLLGGPIFTLAQHMPGDFGADVISTDAGEAVARVRELF